MELTNALAVDYEDPTLEGQNISFTCRPGQMLNGSNSSTCMGNGEWEPDPRAVTCTGTSAATGATLVTTTAGTSTCYDDLQCSLTHFTAIKFISRPATLFNVNMLVVFFLQQVAAVHPMYFR